MPAISYPCGLMRGNFSPFDSLAYILNTRPNCFRLFWQLARRAASRARARAGSNMAAKIPMIAMTTKSSISVKPFLFMTYPPMITF